MATGGFVLLDGPWELVPRDPPPQTFTKNGEDPAEPAQGGPGFLGMIDGWGQTLVCLLNVLLM